MTTGVTLLVLVVILIIGLFIGGKSLLAPLPGADDGGKKASSCDSTSVKRGQRIAARQVQVSVYNAGTRSGLADKTMAKLTGRGFKKGAVGNAPDDSGVKRVQVWTTRRHDTAARLVANQFGRQTKVVLKDSDLGPGVDVVVGNGFDKLARARTVAVARRTAAVCDS